MSARKPPPTMLPCGHFATTERDGQPACLICAEKASVERIKAEAVSVIETEPDPTSVTVTRAVAAAATGGTEPRLTVLPDLIQGTEEWLRQRCGIVTASVVGRLITPTLKVAKNDVSRGLTVTLAAERITGHVDPVAISSDMWRGIEDEPRAREVYGKHFAPVEEVGLMLRDDWGFKIGYSPDGLVGDDGLIECKSRLQKKHVQTILADQVPAENMAQLQCGLLVSGREWVDYVSYSGGMPLWVKRVTPDRAWFDVIVAAVDAFESAAADIVARYWSAVDGLPLTERTPTDIEIEF